MQPAVTAEIHTRAILGNLEAIHRRTGGRVPLCPAVKADAYGHGVKAILSVLEGAGVERLAVAQLEEALELRSLGWNRPILCLGAPLLAGGDGDGAARAREALRAGIHCTVTSIPEARVVAEEARRLAVQAQVELKVDSGMGRMGVLPERLPGVYAELARLTGLQVSGIYTHFATADEQNLSFAHQQLSAFLSAVGGLGSTCAGSLIHAANSAAIFNLREAHLDMVRPGLALYGYWGGNPAERPQDLTPAMRVVSRLVAVRRLPANHAVGYGCTFHTTRDTLVGVVPLGYADGYRRLLSGCGVMTVEGERGRRPQRVPVIGRVSMDLVTVDVTDVPDVQVGDRIVVIDNDPQAPNSVEAMARQLGTIPYEVTCLMGPRVPRVAV